MLNPAGLRLNAEALQSARKAFRVGRVFFLGGVVYTAGYSAGSVAYGSDPDRFETMAMEDSLKRLGSPDVLPAGSRIQKNASLVATRVVDAARMQAALKVDAKALEDLPPLRVVVVEMDAPVVSTNPLMSGTLFVSTGALKGSDAATAMAIATQVVGDRHFQHSSLMGASAAAAVLQMSVLAILDPTGLLTAAVEGVMLAAGEFGPTVRSVWAAQQQTFVDTLALKVVSRAGYDPATALGWFNRLHAAQAPAKAAGAASKSTASESSAAASYVASYEAARRALRRYVAQPLPLERRKRLAELAGAEGAATALYYGARGQRIAQDAAWHTTRLLRSAWDLVSGESGIGMKEAAGWAGAFFAVLLIADRISH